ncbi:hypothetical protein R5W24_001871 [Gemmata sp. JC717]|uniref:hypothetical protein n=1 Tax=Gemmata algarum TaxID=2975278 RepID=UPI0021BA800A|nr:hypothetical protein [Gemmata algarum]MDY3552782.1 hypothetical protein [Gemmata algarum]
MKRISHKKAQREDRREIGHKKAQRAQKKTEEKSRRAISHKKAQRAQKKTENKTIKKCFKSLFCLRFLSSFVPFVLFCG